jgi:RNA polymerase sigma-70 factor (ECF subfamily)
MEDSTLLQRVRAGDENAFELIFRQHYASLCAFAGKILEDADLAEEVVQDLFTHLWERRADLSAVQSVQGYLFQAARNACLNHIKHRKVRARFADHVQQYPGADHQPNAYDHAELESRIRTAVAALPQRCREIFEMSRVEGLKYQEIADKLHLSPRTIEVQIGKALKLLRTHLHDFLPFLAGLWIGKGGWW